MNTILLSEVPLSQVTKTMIDLVYIALEIDTLLIAPSSAIR